MTVPVMRAVSDSEVLRSCFALEGTNLNIAQMPVSYAAPCQ
jgi:hypothetical protein